MTDYSDLFNKHEADPLLRELNGNVLWYWKPMNPHDTRLGSVSNAPFDAASRIEELERFKSLHAQCDKASLDIEQKLVNQLAVAHKRIEALELALWQIARAKSDPCDKFCGAFAGLQKVAAEALGEQ
jgi:hypothetical protein